MKRLMTMALSLMFAGGMAGMAVAGSLDSPGSPSTGSGMYTLQNLYDYLTSGTALTVQSGFQEPASAPGSTMKTTKEIGDGIKAEFDQCTATAADVISGKTFFSTASGSWGIRTGIIARTLSYNVHTEGQCTSAGGQVFSDPEGGGTLCKFQASSCPTGWIQEQHWQQYPQSEWGGDDCGYHKNSGPTQFSNVISYCYWPMWIGYTGSGGCDPNKWNTKPYETNYYIPMGSGTDCDGGRLYIGCR